MLNNRMKIEGLRMDPCGTPNKTSFQGKFMTSLLFFSAFCLLSNYE